MNLPVIRVEADNGDRVASEAFQALVESHPGIVESDDVPYPVKWHNGVCWHFGIPRSEVRQALAEAALWVDVNGVPIDPPLGVVRVVTEWLLSWNISGPEYVTESEAMRMAGDGWERHLAEARRWFGESQ
ncbi:MAG: hypothetical protein AAF682_00105 [Planctomycetota bacterium]